MLQFIGMGSLIRSICDEFECYYALEFDDGNVECIKIINYQPCQVDGDFETKKECEDNFLARLSDKDIEEELERRQENLFYSFTRNPEPHDLSNRSDRFYNTILSESDK